MPKPKPEAAAPEAEPEKKIDEVEVAAATLVGDVRDFLLDNLKHIGKPWPAMSEIEQNNQIDRAKRAAETFVKKAVIEIAAGGKKRMTGTLIKVQVKDNIQTQINFSKTDELRHALFDAQGAPIVIILADSAPFAGERGPAEAQPDQPDLISNAERLKTGGKVAQMRPSTFLDDDENERE